MPPSRPDAEAPDPRVNRALRELFEREDRGEAVDRDAFLTGHADIADVLRSFLADAEELRRRVAAPPAGEVSTDRSLGETYRPASPGADGALSEVFGRYRVVRLLGKGAMGAVYLAEDTELSRRVALKVPAVGGDRPAELVERFRREARAAATLRSPNICPVFDVGEIGGRHYLSMAYIEGRTLAEVIRAEGPQPERRALLTARKLALALQEAHDHGVVHRDLKPGNVMVDGRGEPVVTDFGLASYAADGAARLTHSGVILGSPAYMSPEQLEGRPEKVTAAADQYALGVVLYEMLTGRLPFSGPVSVVVAKIVTQPAPSARALRPDLDPRTDALCLRMLAKSPQERFASTRAVAEALTAILKDPAGGAPEAEPAKAAPRPADPPAGGPEPAETVPPAGGIQRQVAALVRHGEFRAALDLLEPIAARPPGKLSDWARGQQARLRERLDGQDTTALCLVAAKLIRRHDYAEAKKILAAVPPGLRTEELSDLLREAEDKDEESGLLVGDIERAIRDGRADELPRLVKRLLQLKPGHSAGRALAADLKKHGPEAVVRLRQGRRRPFDPAGPAWSRWHVAGFAGGLAAVCVAAYLWASVLHVPSTLPGVDDSPPSDERAVTPENDTAATAVTPAGTAAAGGWFDLLAAVDPAKAHPDLRLTRDGAFLTATRSDPADTGWVSLVSPREFAGDYDLELEYLLVGAKHVAVAFPVDETNVCATFTEAGSALHRIDGKEVDVRDVPPPHGNPDLAAREGVPHRVDVSVRHHGGDVAVETRLDGAAAGRFDGPASRLSDPFQKPRRLKITTYFGDQTDGRRIELRTARVRVLAPSPSAPAVPTVVSPAPAAAPPAGPAEAIAEVIIDADFRTSDGGFARGDQGHILAEHEKGEYRYLGKKPGWWFGGLHPALWAPENGRLKDFAAEFEVRTVGKKKGAIGLEFGHSGDDTLTLCLNQDGQVKLLRGSDRDVVPYSAPPAMRPPGEFNTIRLAVEGETARVSVNGSPLFEKPLERYSAGAVNLWLNPEDVPFDTRLRRFRLERLGAAPPAPDRELRRFNGHADIIREVAFLPDGSRAVSVGHGGAFKLWDVATGELLHDFPPHPADVTSVSVSADGRRALTGCDDGLVRLWDLEAKGVLRTLKGHAAPALSVRISRDGLAGISAATDGSIRRWDLKPGGRSAVLPGPPLPSHLAVSPDERVVASGYDDGTVLLRHPEALGSLVGHGPSHIEGLAFTPDGTKLATGSGDGTVRVWDVSNGKELHRFESEGGGCNGVAVTADGRYLVAGFGDHSIVGWDLDTEDKVFGARADLPVTHRIALSPDGRFVLSGGGERLWKAAGDYDLRLWRLPAPPAPP